MVSPTSLDTNIACPLLWMSSSFPTSPVSFTDFLLPASYFTFQVGLTLGRICVFCLNPSYYCPPTWLNCRLVIGGRGASSVAQSDVVFRYFMHVRVISSTPNLQPGLPGSVLPVINLRWVNLLSRPTRGKLTDRVLAIAKTRKLYHRSKLLIDILQVLFWYTSIACTYSARIIKVLCWFVSGKFGTCRFL